MKSVSLFDPSTRPLPMPTSCMQRFMRFMKRNQVNGVRDVPAAYQRALNQAYEKQWVKDGRQGVIKLTQRGENVAKFVEAHCPAPTKRRKVV